MHKGLHSQSQEGSGSTNMSQWHGGKGSKRRNSNEKLYSDNWEKIFGKPEPKIKAHKKTPSHGLTQVHKDKTKYNRKVSKQELGKDEFQ